MKPVEDGGTRGASGRRPSTPGQRRRASVHVRAASSDAQRRTPSRPAQRPHPQRPTARRRPRPTPKSKGAFVSVVRGGGQNRSCAVMPKGADCAANTTGRSPTAQSTCCACGVSIRMPSISAAPERGMRTWGRGGRAFGCPVPCVVQEVCVEGGGGGCPVDLAVVRLWEVWRPN